MRPNRPQRQPHRTFQAPSIGLNSLLVIIAINVVFYLATLVAPTGHYPWGPYVPQAFDKITYYLGLIPYYLSSRPWTVVTAMFIHANFLHILFNMIALFFFGRALRHISRAATDLQAHAAAFNTHGRWPGPGVSSPA